MLIRYHALFHEVFVCNRYDMKRLGAGWQYAAYDLGTGRVRKVRRHPLAQAAKIAAGLIYGKQFTPQYLRSEQKRINVRALESIAHVRSIPKEDLWIFGNPTFSGTHTYEQDKVRTLGEVMRDAPLAEARRLIDEYVALLLLMWEYGLSETSFNFMWNAGIDSRGRVVLIDFGELTDEKQTVAEQIDSERWLAHYVFKYFTGPTREYLGHAFKEGLTKDQLDAHWGRRLTHVRPAN